MRNTRAILIGILCVLSVVSAAYGQDPPDSHIVTITEKIDLRELNTTVKRLDTTVGELNKTVGELNKTLGELETTVKGIDERTQGIAKVQHVILSSFIGSLVVAIIAPIVYYVLTQKIMNSENKSDPAPTQASQPNQSTAAATNPAPISEDKTAPSPTVPSKFPEGKALEEYLKYDSHATREKV